MAAVRRYKKRAKAAKTAKADNTPKKTAEKRKRVLPPALKENVWEAGKSGNPAGRPKGSRSKFAETFLKDFLEDWEGNGSAAIAACRSKDPSTYLRVAASILPKELNIKDEDGVLDKLLDQFTVEQLDQLLVGIASLGIAEKSAAQKDTAAPRGKSDSVH